MLGKLSPEIMAPFIILVDVLIPPSMALNPVIIPPLCLITPAPHDSLILEASIVIMTLPMVMKSVAITRVLAGTHVSILPSGFRRSYVNFMLDVF